jgi:hypothetical protein
MARKEVLKQLKERFLEYYAETPIIKYASMYIGRDENTLHEWMQKDRVFRDRVTEARSKWVARKVNKVKAEFALERMEKSIFSERTELTGAEGKDLPVPILGGYVPTNISNKEDPPAH